MIAFQQLIIFPIFAIILSFLIHGWRAAAAASASAAATPRKRVPPSPPKLPIIGNLHQLGKFPHRSLQSFSHRYGHLMLLHLGSVPVLVASSAAAAREIMKEQDLIFSNRPKLSSPDKLFYGSRDVAFSPHGEYWRQVRSIFVLRLLNNKRVQSFRRVREEETSLMVEDIMRSSAGVVNLSDALVSLTNNVICRVALGRKYGDGREGNTFRGLFGEFLELLGTSPVGDYVPWLAWTNRITGLDARRERMAKLFDNFLERVVLEHREMRERVVDVDFVDILLEFQRESKNSSPVEDDVIKALILDAFSAGTDTTAAALDWTMAELMKNPSAMKALQNEVREVVGSKRQVDEEDLEKMWYLKAVMKETLRLHPPVPLLLPRESTRDTHVLGYDVAAGTRVIINAWTIGRDPSVWVNPDEFNPERFLDTSIDFKSFHFELVPFGAGRRGCPGIAFATSVYELALAKLVHKFDFGLPNPNGQDHLDMSEACGIAIHRKLPLLLLVNPSS